MERKDAAVFDDDILLDSLGHPSQVFERPLNVVRGPRSLVKRETSDSCVVGLGCMRNRGCAGTA